MSVEEGNEIMSVLSRGALADRLAKVPRAHHNWAALEALKKLMNQAKVIYKGHMPTNMTFPRDPSYRSLSLRSLHGIVGESGIWISIISSRCFLEL